MFDTVRPGKLESRRIREPLVGGVVVEVVLSMRSFWYISRFASNLASFVIHAGVALGIGVSRAWYFLFSCLTGCKTCVKVNFRNYVNKRQTSSWRGAIFHVIRNVYSFGISPFSYVNDALTHEVK